MNIEILPAFTIPIGVVKLGPEFCEPLKKYKGIEQFKVNKESDFYVLDKIPDLKRKLIKLFSDYINLQVLHTPNQEYTITTSWITENTTGKHMGSHNHCNSYYSSVFYFDKVSKEHPALEFANPRMPEGFFVEPLRTTLSNCRSFAAPLEEGLIIFFPSYLYHHHKGYEPTEVIRKSLACNYIPIGMYGQGDSTLDTRRIYG